MAIDRNQIAQQAERLVVSGKIEAAIQQYEILARDNPQDMNTINKIGDLYSRLGKRREAIQQYTKIGDHYAKDGFFLKAIAIFKKIGKLDPSHLDTLSRLADLYARQGLILEARSQFQHVVQQALKSGDRTRAIASLQSLVRHDPDNLSHRSALADLLLAEGKKAEAAEEYAHVAAEMDRAAKPAEARDTYAKALALNPESTAIRTRFAGSLSASGDLERAMETLQEGLVAAPRDPSLLAGLSEIQRLRGEHTQAHRAIEQAIQGPGASAGVLKQGIRHFLDRSEPARAWEAATSALDMLLERSLPLEALDLLDEFLSRQEEHHDAHLRLAEIARDAKQAERAGHARERLLDLCIDQGCGAGAEHARLLLALFPGDNGLKEKADLLRGAHLDGTGRFRLSPAEADRAADDGPEPAAEPQAGAAPAGLQVEDEDFISEHMTEADVFIKYGLTDRAIDQLQAVTARFAGYMPAQIKLKEIFLEDGNREAARSQMVTIIRAQLAAPDLESAESSLAELRRFDPACPELAELAALLNPSMVEAQPAEMIPIDEVEVEVVEISADEAEPDAPSAEDLELVDARLRAGAREEAVNALRALADRFGSHPDLVARMKQAVAMTPVALPSATFEAPSGTMAGPDESFIELEDAEAGEAAPAMETISAAAGGNGGMQTVPRDSRGAAPGIARGRNALPMEADDFLDDLTSEIDAALSGQPDTGADAVAGGEAAPEGSSLEEIVAAFKKGVEQQVAADDHDTHYNLGIAYKEMGLIDEAIGEFQFAAKEARLLVDCCSMLGVCFQEKGMTPLAVKWYRRGIEASQGRDDDTVLGLRYDLAEMLLTAGQRAEALELFTEVYGTNSTFRDVASRLKDLSA